MLHKTRSLEVESDTKNNKSYGIIKKSHKPEYINSVL